MLDVLLLLCLLVTVVMSEVSAEAAERQRVCRSRDSYVPVEAFGRHTCALCYHYLPAVNRKPSGRWRVTFAARHPANDTTFQQPYELRLTNKSHIVVADPSNNQLIAMFHNKQEMLAWRKCCRQAVSCCQRMIHESHDDNGAVDDNGAADVLAQCPATWDGWQCWSETGANTVARAQCPSYVYFTSRPACPYYASKQCDSSARWFRLRSGNTSREHSDYVSCSPVNTLLIRVYVHLASFIVSMVALLPALVIFGSYTQLSSQRVKIHQQFFLSLLINCTLMVTFKCGVLLQMASSTGTRSRMGVFLSSELSCRTLLVLTKYARLSNYAWQFCEAYYLHRLVVEAFNEQANLPMYLLVGWGVPVVPVLIYCVLRYHLHNSRCWAEPVEGLEWVFTSPCLLSMVVCSVYLVSIIRIVLTKLRADICQQRHLYRKAMRATLVLVPLFGLHLLLTMYRSQQVGCWWTEMYMHANNMLDGLQGAAVACIFCYFNEEVQTLLARSYTNREWGSVWCECWRRRQCGDRRATTTTVIQMTRQMVALPIAATNTPPEPVETDELVARASHSGDDKMHVEFNSGTAHPCVQHEQPSPVAI